MKKEQVLDLMSRIDPDLIEESDAALPAKGRLPRAVRRALTAACLCLALVGTGCAATAVYQLIVRSSMDGEELLYEIYGDVERYPMDSFSGELRAACQRGLVEGKLQDRFCRSREEVQAYLGEDVPALWPDLPGAWCLILPSSEPPAHAVSLIYAAGWEDSVNFTAMASVYTEHCPPGEELEDGKRLIGSLRDLSAPPEYYEMTDGTQAVIYCGSSRCTGVFVKSGIACRASVDGKFSDVPMAELKARLCAALDSFS